MKYVLNMLIAVLLSHCSVAWSMLLKSSGQGQSFAQKKMLERIEQRKVSEAMKVLGNYSGVIKAAVSFKQRTDHNANAATIDRSQLMQAFSDQTIINLANFYSGVTVAQQSRNF